MIQGKKFISPGAWFTMIYPSTWSEFEDGEGSFLFYNPDVWTGNFRISAFKADAAARGSINYGREAVKQELKDNPSASLVKVGRLECAYSKEMFQAWILQAYPISSFRETPRVFQVPHLLPL